MTLGQRSERRLPWAWLTLAAVFVSVSILTLPLPSRALSASAVSTPTAPGEKSSAAQLDSWRTFMAKNPFPKRGCFKAAYPSQQWTQVGCIPTPRYMKTAIPRHGFPPLIGGNGNDISAMAPSGFISTAIGSFDNVNVTSENGTYPSGQSFPNLYILQLNTNFFSTSVCNGAATPAQCRGWEQFLLGNNGSFGAAVGIQYWLLNYGPTCPNGWMQSGSDCYRNGPSTPLPTSQPITNLAQLSLSGTVSATSDEAKAFVGATAYGGPGDNSVNAAAGWQIAEFNVFGGGNGGQATFNPGAAITVRTKIIYGGGQPPTCVVAGFTGETNNLTLEPTAPAPSQPGPAVLFSESTAGNATTSCAYATTVGDTHLFTTHGLFYDFQASGDYVLAKVDPNFVVQARQVSGAPTWPNASVNHGIATQMGKTKVALCLDPTRLYVDDKVREVGDAPLSAPGVQIDRRGNVYFIRSVDGDSVRATVNSTWIDALVGFGHWPAKVTGLLANADNDVSKIASRDGDVLTNPFAFADLYKSYGQSWRVSTRESLLSVCGGSVAEGNPSRFFFAPDLDHKTFNRTRAVCLAAGVKGDAFLDACTLDVAVIGTDAATNAYVNAHQHVLVANPLSKRGGRSFALWLLILIIAVIVLALLLLLRRRTA